MAQSIKIDDKSVVFQAVSLLDRYYDQKHLTVKPSSDCVLTGYTTLFIASKNSEVEPLSLSDVKNHFLQKNYQRSQILQKELDIRQATHYENEVSTLFDFVMLYMKIWKMGCQYKISDRRQWYLSTYKFICETEQAAYDFTKSVLIDSESTKFKASIVVAAIISTTIEIQLKLRMQGQQNGKKTCSPTDLKSLPVLSHL